MEDALPIKISDNDIKENYVNIGVVDGNNYSGYVISKDGTKIVSLYTKQLMKPSKRGGKYYRITLCIKGTKKSKTLSVHRIIQCVLNGSNLGGMVVDHVNRDKENNNLTNLEVVTSRENTIRACGKRVNKLDIITGEILATYDCITDANRALKKSDRNCSIGRVCNGKADSAFGFGWERVITS